VHLQLLLVAVAVESRDKQQAARVVLNPSGAGSSNGSSLGTVVIDAQMKGFFICQSQDDAKRVLFYCERCHSNATDANLVNRCACSDKGEKTTPSQAVMDRS